MKAAWAACSVVVVLSIWSKTAVGEENRGGTPDGWITGSTRFNYFHSDNHLNDTTGFPGTTVELKLEPALGDNLNAKFEVRGTNPNLANHGTAVVSLTEGYITWQAETFRARLGKQIVAWGRTDGINPTDNLTPRDYVLLLPFEEDQRFGTPALTVDRPLNDEFSLAFFTTPFFEPSKIPLQQDQAVFVEQKPGHKLSDSEFGVRLNRAGGHIDWSASYFHGYSLFPDFRPAGFTATLPILSLNYPKMDVFGTDFSFNLGRYGVRGEVAYHRITEKNNNDPFLRKPYLYYVIGADRTFFDTFNINLQWFGRFVQNYRNPESISDTTERTVAVLNATLNGQQDKYSDGLTARISKTWLNETLKAELLAVVHRTRHNWYLRPLLTYDANDHVKLSIGATIYRGIDDTFFGRLKKNQGAFVELRYTF